VTFKTQSLADRSVFTNTDEFGEETVIEYELDGYPVSDTVNCVFEGNGDTVASFEGVIDRDILIHASAAAFTATPTVHQRLVIGGQPANVTGVSEDQGMLEIRVRWLDS
jgi:hypothetical protein